MAPETLSATFASIVGLICTYRQEVGARKEEDHRQFMEWLESHRHQEIRDQIANNHHLQNEVAALLREDHQVMIQKLNHIEELLARMLSRMDGFGPIAKTLHPELEFSDQALHILRQFVEGGGGLMVTDLGVDPTYGFVVPGSGQVTMWQPGERDFFEDDLGQLLGAGLIARTGSDQRGNPECKLTRVGAKFIQDIAPAK